MQFNNIESRKMSRIKVSQINTENSIPIHHIIYKDMIEKAKRFGLLAGHSRLINKRTP